jgi:hypothetical protein
MSSFAKHIRLTVIILLHRDGGEPFRMGAENYVWF